MDTRGPRFIRRGAFVATAATTLLALAALGGPAAAAAPSSSGSASSTRAVSPGVSAFDLSTLISGLDPAPVMVHLHQGGCGPDMLDS
jgi:hypothetical protein